jgi:adenine/guanine phosphoribosyltransferase-like PRPP-binding protein
MIVATVLVVSHIFHVGDGSVKLLMLDASGHTEKEVSLDEARMEVARAILDGRAVIAVDDSSETGTPLSGSDQLTEKHKLTYILHPMAGG